LAGLYKERQSHFEKVTELMLGPSLADMLSLEQSR